MLGCLPLVPQIAGSIYMGIVILTKLALYRSAITQRYIQNITGRQEDENIGKREFDSELCD